MIATEPPLAVKEFVPRFHGALAERDALWVLEVPSRFEIDDALWAEIEPLISPRVRRQRYLGRKALPDRLALNGIVHVLHTGIAWRDLPRSTATGPV